MHGKQTYKQIAEEYGKSKRWVQNIIGKHLPHHHFIEPCTTSLIIDAVFFGRTEGVLVFRSPTLKKNLGWYSIEQERVDDYVMGIMELVGNGFIITGITVDGKPGVLAAIQKLGIPVQMCHFHQIQIVARYTTKRPRIPAARELLALVRMLPQTDQESFEFWLQKWHKTWKEFLNEKSWDVLQQRYRFTHERLRKAYRSIVRHLPYLFTYHHSLCPNTTNSLDGSFAHLKDKVRIHRGLSHLKKRYLIYEILAP